MRISFWFIIVAAGLSSCASNPYAESNRIHKKQAKQYLHELKTFPPETGTDQQRLQNSRDWVGTTNFNLRKPNFVVLHHTAQESVEHTLKTFTLPRTEVSAHYVIADDGTIYHMLNDYYRAWHGGVGKWGNLTDLNSASIGIELDNNGFEPFSEAQIASLIGLLTVLKEKYNIPAANFIGHSDMAPSRKVDPNITFPWKRLSEAGFGYWYDEDAVKNVVIIDGSIPKAIRIEGKESAEIPPVKAEDTTGLPPDFDPVVALRIIGYDVSNFKAAVRAFKLHFIQKDVETELSDEDLQILYNLYQKYL